MFYRPIAGAAALLLLTAADLPNAAATFGARETVEQASLSPDGTKLAYLGPVASGQGSALYVAPLDGSGEAKAVVFVDGSPDRLSNCRWASSARLICSIYGVIPVDLSQLSYFSRLIAIDPDGKNTKILQRSTGSAVAMGANLYGGSVIDWLPDGNGSVLMMRAYVPEETTGTLLSQSREGIGVDKVDTRTLSASRVEPPNAKAVEYITDGYGNVRIMGLNLETNAGRDRGMIRYSYRSKGSRDWKTLSTVDESARTGFNPHGVDSDLDVAYGLKELDGRLAAYKVALDGSMKETLVFARPDVDVDGFVRIGRRGRIIGVSYATEKRQAVYFDPVLEKLSQSLAKAIPDLPLIRFVDASVDENRLLLWAGSDQNPGRYFLFDRQARKLTPLMDVRPNLEKVALAPVKPVSYQAADGTMIPAYLTLPPGKESAKGLPGIVMPHGGPGSRDEWGFDWLSQFFANRGYAVLQPNFRGSEGYGDAWFQKNGFQNWRAAIGDVDDGGRWLVSQGIVDAKKMAIVGWSYGGYAALQSAVTEPGLFKAVVAIAPVTDLEMLKDEHRDYSDYNVVSRFIGSGPHVEAGSPARNAEKIKVPVLMFHGTHDLNVGIGQSRTMASRLKGAGASSELVEYEKHDHYLEDSKTRADMLDRSERFLKASLGL
jgi:dipeptidyl aminopeptidase/acylaminoacyl peptidase